MCLKFRSRNNCGFIFNFSLMLSDATLPYIMVPYKKYFYVYFMCMCTTANYNDSIQILYTSYSNKYLVPILLLPTTTRWPFQKRTWQRHSFCNYHARYNFKLMDFSFSGAGKSIRYQSVLFQALLLSESTRSKITRCTKFSKPDLLFRLNCMRTNWSNNPMSRYQTTTKTGMEICSRYNITI